MWAICTIEQRKSDQNITIQFNPDNFKQCNNGKAKLKRNRSIETKKIKNKMFEQQKTGYIPQIEMIPILKMNKGQAMRTTFEERWTIARC